LFGAFSTQFPHPLYRWLVAFMVLITCSLLHSWASRTPSCISTKRQTITLFLSGYRDRRLLLHFQCAGASRVLPHTPMVLIPDRPTFSSTVYTSEYGFDAIARRFLPSSRDSSSAVL
jgi:hypothetical protein